jgi:hypothetical protein
LQVNKSTARQRLAVWGILIFIILYIVGAALYPGGNDINKTAAGFSWQHNYWCELMAPSAQNGQPNAGRPVAIIALTVLVASLMIFWYRVPLLFSPFNTSSHIIRICGIGSMLAIPLLLAGIHDTAINLAGLLGCIAIVLLLTKLFSHNMHFLFLQGICCLLLCGVNNYFYYTKGLLYYLPVIQKISFLFFLLWFIQLSIKQNRNK